jgi:hypothetical protein
MLLLPDCNCECVKCRGFLDAVPSYFLDIQSRYFLVVADRIPGKLDGAGREKVSVFSQRWSVVL